MSENQEIRIYRIRISKEAAPDGKALMPYAVICHALGFDPASEFVAVRNGRIGFTAGKPEEVKTLLHNVKCCGFVPTPGLVRAVELC
jgi:hypothetical protein